MGHHVHAWAFAIVHGLILHSTLERRRLVTWLRRPAVMVWARATPVAHRLGRGRMRRDRRRAVGWRRPLRGRDRWGTSGTRWWRELVMACLIAETRGRNRVHRRCPRTSHGRLWSRWALIRRQPDQGIGHAYTFVIILIDITTWRAHIGTRRATRATRSVRSRLRARMIRSRHRWRRQRVLSEIDLERSRLGHGCRSRSTGRGRRHLAVLDHTALTPTALRGRLALLLFTRRRWILRWSRLGNTASTRRLGCGFGSCRATGGKWALGAVRGELGPPVATP